MSFNRIKCKCCCQLCVAGNDGTFTGSAVILNGDDIAKPADASTPFGSTRDWRFAFDHDALSPLPFWVGFSDAYPLMNVTAGTIPQPLRGFNFSPTPSSPEQPTDPRYYTGIWCTRNIPGQNYATHGEDKKWVLCILYESTTAGLPRNGNVRILWLGYKCGPGPCGTYKRQTDNTRHDYGQATSPDELHVCCVEFTPSSASFDSQPHSSSVAVAAGCSWTATASAGWITITSGGLSAGDETISYSISENTTTSARTGYIDVLGVRHTINQSACVITADIDDTEFDGDGGTATITITADDEDCEWAASADSPWITLDSNSGTGSGTITVTVAENPSTDPRTGTVTVSGTTFDINQAGRTLCTDCPADWSGFASTLTLTVAGITGGCEASNGTVTLTRSGSEYADASGKWMLYCYTDFGTGEAIFSLDFVGATDFLQFQKARASDCSDDPTGSYSNTSTSCGGAPTASIST